MKELSVFGLYLIFDMIAEIGRMCDRAGKPATRLRLQGDGIGPDGKLCRSGLGISCWHAMGKASHADDSLAIFRAYHLAGARHWPRP